MFPRRIVSTAIVFSAAFLALGGLTAARADVHLAGLFTDHMVLQRGIADPVWGTADPGEAVTVSIADQTKSAKAGADGTWKVLLSPMAANGNALTMTVKGNNSVTLSDVKVGEVWICSGQSNMQFGMGNLLNPATEIAAANFPDIRLYTVPMLTSPMPATTVAGHWDQCSPDTIAKQGTWAGFTAVGYFFGRDLYQKLNVPIGLIETSWGGTNGESWIAKADLDADPDMKALEDEQVIPTQSYAANVVKFGQDLAAWEKTYGTDTGIAAAAQGWADPAFDDSQWKTTKLPATWRGLGMKSGGSVWLRKSVDVPQAAANKVFILRVGKFDADVQAFWNGTALRASGQRGLGTDPDQARAAKFSSANVTFPVPAKLVLAGKNEVAFRVFAQSPLANVGPERNVRIVSIEDSSADADPWHFNVEASEAAIPGATWLTAPRPPAVPSLQNTATYLYNAMINPLVPFGVRGAIWYQGENNAGRAYQYRKVLPTLIEGWRKAWGEGDFPFYIVQLANFMKPSSAPGDSAWAELREAQTMTAQNVPNAGEAVTIDIGDSGNIHPKDKQDVGARLSFLALNRVYGVKMEDQGPLYQSMTVEGNKIRLKFTHADGLASQGGGALKQFEIAGGDKSFVWADAVIDGSTVLVSSPTVANPVAVRYAWANDPEGCNLTNAAGIPASPFRTDDWPGVTAASK
jgi:sialate O-acetylesterase